MKDMLTSRGIDVRKLRLKDDYIAAMHSYDLFSDVEEAICGKSSSLPITIPLYMKPIIRLFEKAIKEHPTLFVKRNLETEWKVSELFPSNTHF